MDVNQNVPSAPKEALHVDGGGKCTVPFVPGMRADGTGAFRESAAEWLGHPLTVKKGDSFDIYLAQLSNLVRYYNHWLYRLRRVKLRDKGHTPPLCHDMPRPPGHTAGMGEDDEKRTDHQFTLAALELNKFLDGGFSDASGNDMKVILDPVRVNDYIVSMRVLASPAGGAALLRGVPGEPSSSHISLKSVHSSRWPNP